MAQDQAHDAPSEDEDEEKGSPFRAHMLNTAFGVSYDLKHWHRLPPREGARKVHYVLTTGGRFPYVLIWVLLLALFVVGVSILASTRSFGRRRQPPKFF